MPDIYKQISIEEVIITICAVIVLVVAIASFFTFLYAIYLFLFSKDKDAKNAKGQATIRYMIIGVVLTVLFLLCLPFALKGVNVELKNYGASAIFSRAEELIQSTFKIGMSVKNIQNKGNGLIPKPLTTSPYEL